MRWKESSSVEELGALCVGNLTSTRVGKTSFFDSKKYAFLFKSAAKYMYAVMCNMYAVKCNLAALVDVKKLTE